MLLFMLEAIINYNIYNNKLNMSLSLMSPARTNWSQFKICNNILDNLIKHWCNQLIIFFLSVRFNLINNFNDFIINNTIRVFRINNITHTKNAACTLFYGRRNDDDEAVQLIKMNTRRRRRAVPPDR